MLSLFNDALQQTLLFFPLILGIYLTYRIVNITDLTVGGSYVLGASIFARLLTCGMNQILASSIAISGGLLAGFGVFLLQHFAKINSLIASILSTFILSSLCFGIMGEPNISLLENQTILNYLQNLGTIKFDLSLILASFMFFMSVYALLKSKLGLQLRAYGKNPNLLHRLGHGAYRYLALGLILSNGLAALCGLMNAEINGYADIHMDDGIALTAIGAVVIGGQILHSTLLNPHRYYPLLELCGCLLGAYIYFYILHLLLTFNINPIYLKLCLGFLLIIFLSSAHYGKGQRNRYESLITD